MPTGSISQATKLILSGTSISSSYTYYFASAFPSYASGKSVPYGTTPGGSYTLSSTDFMNLTSTSESAAAASLTAIDRVADVSFNYLNNQSADIVIAGLNQTLFTAAGGQVGAFAYYPSGTDPIRSDLWILQGGSTPSTIHTIIQHELLHAIGLRDVSSSGGSSIYTGVEDTNQYTIMSYSQHPEENRFATELQIYDIAALQAIYGRDDGYNSGDTTISQFAEMSGPYSGQDRMFSVWDGNGTDTIDASGLSNRALIDLRPGQFSSIGPNARVDLTAGAAPVLVDQGRSNISIAFGAYIENAKGTTAGDLIIGNLLSNRLEGGDGDDVMYAEGADSIHDAGSGTYDRVTNVGASKTETAPTDIKAFVDDPTKQIDHLVGGAGNDYLRGGRGNDIIEGGADNDILIGGGGNDELWGGAQDAPGGPSNGTDKVDYSGANAGISITFNGSGPSASVTVDDGEGGTDTLHSIEEILGTSKRDYFSYTGDIPNDFHLKIDAGTGQTGSDILALPGASDAVHLAIDGSGNGTLTTESGNGQIDLVNFHTQVIGSNHDDVLTDSSSGDKTIDGGGGDDTISVAGSSGDATLLGGRGADTITGGGGNDFLESDPYFSFVDEINYLNGGGGSDLIYSNSRFDVIDGGDGHDYIKLFRGGNETTIRGGAGNDVIEDTYSQDTVHVIMDQNSGNDVIFGAASTDLNGIYTALTLENVSLDDVSLIWDAPLDSNSHVGNLAIVVNSTGASLLIKNIRGHSNESGTGFGFQGSINGFGLTHYHIGSHVTVQGGSTSQYDVALANYQTATATAPGDINGTSANDDLKGGQGNDAMAGGAGDDNFDASAGNDSIDGGDGNDTLNLFGLRAFHSITQSAGVVTIIDLTGAQMTLTSVENVYFAADNKTFTMQDLFGYYGTEAVDTIVATDADSKIFALGGDDFIRGKGGNDEIDGGDGFDTAIFAGRATDYVITQESNGRFTVSSAAIGADRGTDTLLNVEAIQFLGDGTTVALTDQVVNGTSADDVLTSGFGNDVVNGLAGNDSLASGLGNDILSGGDGDDLLEGGLGFDTIDGGDGFDTTRYSGSSGDYSIYFDEDGVLRISPWNGTGTDSYDGLQGVEALQFLGDSTTILVDDLPPLGTIDDDLIEGTARRDVLYGLGGNDTLAGAAGNDTLEGGDGADSLSGGDGDDELVGGAGADVMMGGVGDDYYVVDEAGDVVSEAGEDGYDMVEASISYTLGAGLESLYLYGDDPIDGTGNALDNEISGDSNANTLSGMDGDDILTGGESDDVLIGGNGLDRAQFWGDSGDYSFEFLSDGSLRITDLVWDEGQDILTGIETLYFDGDGVTVDLTELVINGTEDDDILEGAGLPEQINGLGGDDTLTGAGGNDTLDGGNGFDTAVYTGWTGDYMINTSGGSIQITDAYADDGDEGSDTLVSVEQAQFVDDTLNLTMPIVLDLDGDGIELVDSARSTARFDLDGDGIRDRTGWIGKGDGILVYDRNGDGRLTDASEISFIDDVPGARSDLEGLAAFDSNGDGKFSEVDEKFGSFFVWKDKDVDGAIDRKELLTLDKAKVASIDLAGIATEQTWDADSNIIVNQGSFTRTNGQHAALGDVALNYISSRSAAAADPAQPGVENQLALMAQSMAAFGAHGGGAELWTRPMQDHAHFDYFM